MQQAVALLKQPKKLRVTRCTQHTAISGNRRPTKGTAYQKHRSCYAVERRHSALGWWCWELREMEATNSSSL